jgi:hypothetical protein
MLSTFLNLVKAIELLSLSIYSSILTFNLFLIFLRRMVDPFIMISNFFKILPFVNQNVKIG